MKLRNFPILSENKATVDVHRVCFYDSLWCIVTFVSVCHGYKHIGVGFCVARSDRVGNAKASKCGTSDSDRLPRFFLFESKNEEANRIVQSVAQSLGLSKGDMASIVLNSMNNDPEQEIDKIMHGLSEIQDKNLVSELYSKSMRLAEISGDRETVGFAKRVFEELR